MCNADSAEGRWCVATGRFSMSTTMMSASVRRPLSLPEMVIAAWLASMRMEKLPAVAGVQPLGGFVEGILERGVLGDVLGEPLEITR